MGDLHEKELPDPTGDATGMLADRWPGLKTGQGGDGWTGIPNVLLEIMAEKGLSPGAQIALITLLRHDFWKNTPNVVTVGRKKLGDCLGVSERQAARYREELVRAKMIRVEKFHSGKGWDSMTSLEPTKEIVRQRLEELHDRKTPPAPALEPPAPAQDPPPAPAPDGPASAQDPSCARGTRRRDVRVSKVSPEGISKGTAASAGPPSLATRVTNPDDNGGEKTLTIEGVKVTAELVERARQFKSRREWIQSARGVPTDVQLAAWTGSRKG